VRAIAALLLITACASSDGLVRNEIPGGPGQDIAVGIVDVDTGQVPLDMEGTRQYIVHFEVTNMTRTALTVERISIKRSSMTAQAFQVQTTSRVYNELIDPGKDHVFPVPLRGRQVRAFQNDERRVVEFDVIISLTNGDTYLYTFEGPVREDPRRF